MKKHDLKILPQYFQAVWSGIKTFELRKDDRDYQRGDILVLREWDGEKYTGSAICVKVTYILQNAEKYGLKDGYVIMGICHLGLGDMREESKPYWIPSEDCLPVNGEEVITLGPNGGMECGFYRGLCGTKRDKWEWKKHTVRTVKYWMPRKALPEPPKEEK